jgi:hypothetical protein
MVCHRIGGHYGRTDATRAVGRLAILLAVWSVSVGHGRPAEIRPGRSIPAYTLGRVILGQGEEAWVLPMSEDGNVDTIESNREIAFTGPPGTYWVIWRSETQRGQFRVRILPPGPEPGPGPEPPPGPSGFAGEVYKQAAAIGDKAFAFRLAAVFREIHAQIGRDLTSLQAVYDATTARTKQLQTPANWYAFNTWLSKQLGERAQSVAQAKAAYGDIATGLETAAK